MKLRRDMATAQDHPPGCVAPLERQLSGPDTTCELGYSGDCSTPPARSSEQACLLACSRAPMVNLHDQLGSQRISILLVDTNGWILDMVGEAGARPQASEHWPHPKRRSPDQPLADAEHRNVGASEHENSVFGIAAPINAASGGLIGILDRSGGHGVGLQHIGAMLQLTAETIERRVVEHDARGFLLLRFHTRIELLEGPCDAIALFDRDSRLIAYNKLAANLLSLTRSGLNALCQDCFETQWPGLVGSAAFAKNAPIHLRARNGTHVLAHARLR